MEPIIVSNLRNVRQDYPDARLVQREGWWIIASHGQAYGGPEEGGWWHERWSTLAAVRGSRQYAAYEDRSGDTVEQPLDFTADGKLDLPPEVAAIEAMLRERSDHQGEIWTHWHGDEGGAETKAPCGGGTFGGYS